MADSGGSNPGRRSSHGAAQPSVPRRLSYASVVTGAPSHRVGHPTRPGISEYAASNSYHNIPPPSYFSDYRRAQSELPIEKHRLIGQSNLDSMSGASALPISSRKHAALAGKGSGSFFIPSYLESSRYAAKLQAAYIARARTFHDQTPNSGSHHGLLPASSSNPRLTPSHRGMTYDVIENNPPSEEELIPLPSRWNNQDKYPGLDLLNEGLDVRYSGTAGKADLEAASVRADFPISPQCGIYYYEINIKQKNKDCAVAIGFSSQKSSLERLPGWEPDSWAYHGDDGKAFEGEQQGRTYGPVFGMGDVVGCGINFRTGQAFFTKNGQDLGIAFRQLKSVAVFPCVGMKKYSGALINVNFGQHPFTFDICEKMALEETVVQNHVWSTRTTRLHPGQDTSTFTQDLVAQFLSHAGFIETAKSFQEQVEHERNNLHGNAKQSLSSQASDTSDARPRQQIRQAILKGDIDSALDMIRQHFPDLLESSSQIVFKLKCRKWVEIIAKAADLRSGKSGAHAKSKRTSNGVTSTGENVFDQAMEVDEDHAPSLNGNGKAPAHQQVTTADPDSPEIVQLNEDALKYGQMLQAEYGNMGEEYGTMLREIFSLIPYLDPRQSINGHLLDLDGRSKVAEELNSAILESLGKAPAAALETTWRQTEALIEILSQQGGPASFVNLQRDFER